MQHCGNCGALLGEEELRRGKCAVCQRAVTPDIDTIPASSPQSYRMGQMNAPASQPFLGPMDDGAEQRVHVSVHGQIGIQHGGVVVVQPAARPRRRGWLVLLGALVLIFVAATLALLFMKPAAGGKVASQHMTATTSASVNGTATATTSVATLTGGATAAPQPSGAPGVANATPTAGGAGGGNPTTIPAVTATPLPTATQAPNNPPALYMNPTAVRFTLCLSASTSFTIKNTGGGTLKWNAVSSDYTIQSPTQGTLNTGQIATVMVKGIVLGGSVTVNATDLAGHALLTSPQTFTVVCTA